MGGTKKIGTHNGKFHCDEALACFLLKLLPEYKDAEIVRSRDPSVLDVCDIVVDVGAVYDVEKKRFDHHQKSFEETMKSLRPELPYEIRLSSAGLIYCHFGERIIADQIKRPIDDKETQIIFRKVYEEFIMEIDAIDNGVSMCSGDSRYKISTSVSSRVSNLFPRWNEDQSNETVNERFQDAMTLVGNEFLDKVEYYSEAWLPAKELVRQAIQKRHEVDESGEIIEIEFGGCPWRDHLFDLEAELDIQGEIKYTIFQDSAGSYRVQCIPLKLDGFDNRLSLPWKGLRDDDLTRESEIPGGIFVHVTGFIGGNKTREGALEMARAALKQKRP